MDFKKIIRTVPNYPTEGVMFRDITTILQDKNALKTSVDKMIEGLNGIDFDYVVGPESRGFIFGMPIAYKLNKGFVPVRKKGKLPAETISKEYKLEYGTAIVEIHKDAIKPGDKIVIIDDLLATGGTCRAVIELIKETGGKVVNLSFFIELEALKGRELLKDYNVNSIVKY